MIDIIISLALSSALLIIMIYPAMQITEYINTKIEINEKRYNQLTVSITIFLALMFGAILHFT